MRVRLRVGSFRFHTGSIKRRIGDFGAGNGPSFDSILVRLKVATKNSPLREALFRFHTGSIKSKKETL